MRLKNKRILVTGAGGFIGSHLCEHLCDRSTHVKALLRYNSRGNLGLLKALPRNKFKQIEVIFGDLRDSNAVERAMKNIDIIFHLGALISIPYSYLHPQEYIGTNILGTFNVLKSAREQEIPKVIHVSTSEVYGTALYVPIDEKHPLQAQSPYSATKISAEKIAESFYRSFGTPIAIVRLFNCFGPRQSDRAVIPTIITQALASSKVRIGSLSPRRDFTYVKDIINGLIKVAEADSSIGEVINIGSGYSYSIRNVIDQVGLLLGRKLIITVEEIRKRPPCSEIMELLANNSKAKRILGWEPTTSFDLGLKRTIFWLKNNLSLYAPQKYNI